MLTATHGLLGPKFPISGDKGILLPPGTFNMRDLYPILREMEGSVSVLLALVVFEATLIQNNQYAIETYFEVASTEPKLSLLPPR